MTYRLIVLDLDGTAIVDGQLPSPAVRAAIAAAQRCGTHVVFATGRNYHSARKFAAACDLRSPLICFQGSLIKEVDGAQATLLTRFLPAEPLAEACALAESLDLQFDLYTEDRIYRTRELYPQAFYDLWFELPAERTPTLAEALQRIAAAGQQPIKGIFIAQPAEHDRLAPQLQARFAGRLGVLRSHPLFLEVLAPQASKGDAAAFLAARYGIPREEVIAVGDAENDLSMIAWAGLGVAMGNAAPAVLAAADWVAPSVYEDGVATVIERFVLRNGRGDTRC